MHNHNKNNSENKQNFKTMWLMMLFCALPFLFILFFGAGFKATGASSWLIIFFMIIFAGIHFFMMKKSHNISRERPNKNKSGKNSHSGHGCC